MNFWEEMRWRGQLKEQMHTQDIEQALSGKGHIAYIGFDPTAPSLGIGNLVTVALLRRWQQAGNRPIVLMGGATGKIGDPSGKDQERQLLDYATIQLHIERQTDQMRRLLDFEGDCAAQVVNNADFYAQMDVFTFLRDIGKNITVNYMMSKESVKARMEAEKGISFTEFSYQIIQGYDFQYLNEHHGCELQMGGGDQWGNITTGLEFIRKRGRHAHGFVCPLLTKSDGKKFGKSEEGNIFLAPELTSPYKFYQFWINADDADLPKLWRFFSFKSRAEIEAAEQLPPQEQKRILAEEVTTWVHSAADTLSAQKATEIVFNSRLQRDFLESLSANELGSVAEEVGKIVVPAQRLSEGLPLLEVLTQNSQLSGLHSNSEVRKAIQNNAIAINTNKVSSHEHLLQPADLLHERFILLQNGKKNKFILEVVQ